MHSPHQHGLLQKQDCNEHAKRFPRQTCETVDVATDAKHRHQDKENGSKDARPRHPGEEGGPIKVITVCVFLCGVCVCACVKMCVCVCKEET